MPLTPEMLLDALKSGDDGMSRYRNADTDITGIDGWFDLSKTVERLNAELARQSEVTQLSAAVTQPYALQAAQERIARLEGQLTMFEETLTAIIAQLDADLAIEAEIMDGRGG